MTLDFAHDSVARLFRQMFFPILVGMVSMVVLNIADGAFVGHGVGSDALAAVNIVAPLFMLTGGLGLMFGIGSSVVASIHLSQGNTHAANANLTQGILCSVLCGLVLGALVFLFQPQVCLLFGCSQRLIPLACSYLRWIALLTPFNMFGMTAMFMVRLEGSPRFCMFINCAMALSNILLDWLFIFPLQWGLEGAAIATTTAFSLGNIPVLWYLFTQMHQVRLLPLRFTRAHVLRTLRNLWAQMKIGVSGLIGEVSIALVLIVGNYVFIRHLGEDGVAAYSVGCYCLPIVFMVGNAIVQSVQPIISFAYGQQQYPRLIQARTIALGTAVLTGAAGMLILWLGSRVITTLFLPPDCHAHALCVQGLPLFSSAFLFIAINLTLIGYFQSIEAARLATLFTVLRGIVFTLPSFLLLPLVLGHSGLWLALPAAEATTTLLILLFAAFRRLRLR